MQARECLLINVYKVYIAIENGHRHIEREKVDLPIETGGAFHPYVNIYQKVMLLGSSGDGAVQSCGYLMIFALFAKRSQ